jgi:hypothetical protein
MFGQQLLEDQMRLYQERLGITTLSTPCEMAELENKTVALSGLLDKTSSHFVYPTRAALSHMSASPSWRQMTGATQDGRPTIGVFLTNLSAELYSKSTCFLGRMSNSCGTFPHPISLAVSLFIPPTLPNLIADSAYSDFSTDLPLSKCLSMTGRKGLAHARCRSFLIC